MRKIGKKRLNNDIDYIIQLAEILTTGNIAHKKSEIKSCLSYLKESINTREIVD